MQFILTFQQFLELEKTITDLLSNTKAGWLVEFREEYYRVVNKVTTDTRVSKKHKKIDFECESLDGRCK